MILRQSVAYCYEALPPSRFLCSILECLGLLAAGSHRHRGLSVAPYYLSRTQQRYGYSNGDRDNSIPTSAAEEYYIPFIVCHLAKNPELTSWHGVGSGKDALGNLPFLLAGSVLAVGLDVAEGGIGREVVRDSTEAVLGCT